LIKSFFFIPLQLPFSKNKLNRGREGFDWSIFLDKKDILLDTFYFQEGSDQKLNYVRGKLRSRIHIISAICPGAQAGTMMR